VPVEYERTATQLLLPGAQSMPEESNPFLYLGGLSYPTDILVRALGSENVANEVTDEFPGVKIEVLRDTSSSSPVVLVTATSADDAATGRVLDYMVQRTQTMLADLQDAESIPASNQITVTTLTIDSECEPQSLTRLIVTAVAGVAILAVTLLLASLIDGISRQRRRRRNAPVGERKATSTPPVIDDDFAEAIEATKLAKRVSARASRR